MSNGLVELKIDLADIVTPKSCSAIIAELIKYIVYSKQQIPYPYERLKYYIKRRKETQKQLDISKDVDGQSILLRNIFAVEKHYKKVEEAFEILENTFMNIEEELQNSSTDAVHEVAIVFGSTIMSPKDVYRIQIPSLSIGHSDNRHGVQKQKNAVFRHIIVSEQLQTSLDKQVGLTNMFILLKLKKGIVAKSEWFLPKDNYKISPRISHVCVSFNTKTDSLCNCLSSDLDSEFTPFIDSDSSETSSPSSMISSLSNTDSVGIELSSVSDDVSLEEDIKNYCFATDFVRNDFNGDNENWFQTKQSLKGFRDCKINGKPVVDFWHQSQYFINSNN